MLRSWSLISVIFIQMIWAQQQPFIPKLPCPDIFYYSNDDGRTDWIGYLILKDYDTNERNIFVQMNFSIGAQLNNRYGSLELIGNNFAVVNIFENRLPIYFKVNLPLQDRLPNLDNIYLNNRLICRGPQSERVLVNNQRIRTTYHLHLTVTIPGAGNNIIPDDNRATPPGNNLNQNRPITRPTISTTSTTTRRVQTIRPVNQANKVNDLGLQCGQPAVGLGLVISGRKTTRGEWPWIVAYYDRIRAGQSDFVCGGTLITKKHVITAAHCLKDKGAAKMRAANKAVLYFGKHNLDNLDELNYQESSAKEFILHPDWNVNELKFDADLAIIVTSKTIEFNEWVRPICLWSGDNDLETINKRKGTIIGWGQYDLQSTKLSTNEPLLVEVSVELTLDCLLSHLAFNQIISNRTFCAGNKLGTGPCNGDSGGGFMLFENNAWTLRGVVSVSLLDAQTHYCDVQNNAVFTDIAKFIPWINNIVATRN